MPPNNRAATRDSLTSAPHACQVAPARLAEVKCEKAFGSDAIALSLRTGRSWPTLLPGRAGSVRGQRVPLLERPVDPPEELERCPRAAHLVRRVPRGRVVAGEHRGELLVRDPLPDCLGGPGREGYEKLVN